jgi:hypothetical protein
VLCDLRGFLGWTSGEVLSNRFREITHELLIELSFAQRSALRFPPALFRVRQTFFLSLLDSFRFNENALALVSLPSATPL